MKKIITLALTLFLTEAALACKPYPINADTVKALNAKKSTLITTANQNFLLKLVPSKWALEKGRLVRKRDSYGLAFEATAYGQLKPLWSFKHWDVYNGGRAIPEKKLYLSSDGMNLVVIDDGVKTNSDTNAVITYKKGKKVRGYSPSYFGVNGPRGRHSCGIGGWLKSLTAPGATLETINGQRWIVSPETLYIRKAP